jgi:hypothetical protein
MGRRVLEALGFRTGFTHMEWFRKHDGEVVFGEIGARPPGARLVELMNYCTDNDAFRRLGRGRLPRRRAPPLRAPVERRGDLQARAGARAHPAHRRARPPVAPSSARSWSRRSSLPVGAPRRNWKQTLVGDGYVIVRHPDLETLLEIADRVAREVQLFAG